MPDKYVQKNLLMKALARSTLLYTSVTVLGPMAEEAVIVASEVTVPPPHPDWMLKNGDLEVGLEGGNIVITAWSISRSKSLRLYSIIWYKALISSHLFLRTLSITDSRVTPTVLTMESTVVSLINHPARGSLIFKIWSMMSLVSGLEFFVVQGWLTTASMLILRSGSITSKPWKKSTISLSLKFWVYWWF